MNVKKIFCIASATVLVFSGIAGLLMKTHPAASDPGFEESALVHDGLVHDEPILTGDIFTQPIIITPYN